MGQDLQVLQGAPKVKVGDEVVISLDEKNVEKMQKKHGGWNDDMKNYLGKKGKVQKIDSDGDVEIKFKYAKYVYNPNVVAKVLSKGDIVQISSNREKAKFLQNNHGGWNSGMVKILGKTAHVVHVYKTYDVFVKTGGENWCLNPLLCTFIRESSDNSSSDDDSDSDDDMISKLLTKAAKKTMEQVFHFGTTNIEELMSMMSVSERRNLHFDAVYKGDEKMVQVMLRNGANIDEIDNDGDTSLHIAVIKNNPGIIRLLLSKGAKADILNKKKVAPLHIAILADFKECAKELLDSSINVEDDDGDTPLGLAIMKENLDIIDLLLNHHNIDVTKTNNNGFSAFHLAAQQGDAETVRKMLQKKPDIVDIQKIDGFSALHLAALNDNLGVVKILIQKANAKLNKKEIEGSTPLMLAAHKNHLDIVKLLVSEGADINAQDNDGNTALHLAINRKTGPTGLLEMVFSNTTTGDAVDVVIYLVENGASLSIQNKERKAPLDMIDDDSLKANLQKKANKSQHLPQEKPCLLCSEVKLLVQFKPCGHLKICAECNRKNMQIKKCIECQVELTEKIQPETKGKNIDYSLKSLFKNGDQVRINMNEDIFNDQEAKDKPHMKELLKKIGTIVDTDRNNKIHVRFEGKGYLMPPEMLTKVFPCGDEVELLKDVELVKSLQEDHGGWVETIKQIIGKTGKVMQIEEQYISVKFDTKIWHINPMACVGLKKPQQETESADIDTSCCLKCKQTTFEMVQLQCGHMYCSNCKYLRKCISC